MNPIQYPGVVSCNPTRYDLFLVGSDGRSYSNSWHEGQSKDELKSKWVAMTDSWSPHKYLYGLEGASIHAVSRAPGLIEIFVIGAGGIVWTRSGRWWSQGEFQGVTWSEKDTLAGWGRANDKLVFPEHKPIVATGRTSTQIDIFATGKDGRVYTSGRKYKPDNPQLQPYTSELESWFDFEPIGGYFPAGAPVAAVARTSDHLDLFVTGSDGRVYTSWWPSDTWWSGINDNWRSIGGYFPAGAPVTAVARKPEQLDVFITGKDGRVYTSWWPSETWWSGINDNWKSIGGFFPPGAQVSVISRNKDHLDLFVTGNDGRVYTSWWHQGSEWSGIQNHWTCIGGVFPPGAPVSAVARRPDSLDLFIVGSDGAVYTSWWTAGAPWSGVNDHWTSLGKP